MPSWRGNASSAEWTNHAASTSAAAASASGRRLAEEVVLDDAVEGTEAVPHADLLALGVRPPVVRDADLEDAHVHLGHLGGDLRLEAEAVLLDGDGLDDLAAEGLV